MTDISDVEKALVSALSGLFLDNPDHPSGVVVDSNMTLSGQPIGMAIYRGFPKPGDLDQSMNSGDVEITVRAVPGMTRPAKHRSSAATIMAAATPMMSATVLGRVVTFTGTAGPGQLVGIGFDGTGYAHRVETAQTAQDVAQAMAAIIDGSTVNGTQVTVPGASEVVADVVADAVSRSEARRQFQAFEIRIWAPSPEARDLVGSKLSAAMAEVRCIALPNGDATSLPKLMGVWADDFTQKAHVWTRTERYELEYATTIDAVVPGILFAGVNTSVTVRFGFFHPDGPFTPV